MPQYTHDTFRVRWTWLVALVGSNLELTYVIWTLSLKIWPILTQLVETVLDSTAGIPHDSEPKIFRVSDINMHWWQLWTDPCPKYPVPGRNKWMALLLNIPPQRSVAPWQPCRTHTHLTAKNNSCTEVRGNTFLMEFRWIMYSDGRGIACLVSIAQCDVRSAWDESTVPLT